VKRKYALKVVLSTLLGLTLAARAYAIFGVGDIVFDPSNYAESIQQLFQLQQQYAQLVQSYQMLRNQYQQLVWMAKQVPVNMATRYRALATPWQPSSARNTYGTNGAWIRGINTGQGVATGYSQATETLGTYGAAMVNIPADQLDRFKTNYATVELTDGINLSGMETIGRLRANSPAVESAIQGLEDDSLSADPDMNTEVAVLNKINAANLITVRTTQDTNKLLVALAEEQIIEAKRTRDAQAQAINDHIRFVAEGKAVMTAQAAGASQAMLDWRMP
jgi:hypothetical protein